MFIGHLAVAYAGKPVAPRVSLGVLFLAAQLPDLVLPVLVLSGVEQVRVVPDAANFVPLEFTYPFSHSLAAVLLWEAAGGLLYLLLTRDRRGATMVGAAIVSHWALDFVSHTPDLALAPGLAARAGLGLWRSLFATALVEGGLFAGGVWLYLRATRARDRIGSVATWGLVAFLLGLYVANLFGPPPPSATAFAVTGLATWLLVLWAWWADRHREAMG